MTGFLITHSIPGAPGLCGFCNFLFTFSGQNLNSLSQGLFAALNRQRENKSRARSRLAFNPDFATVSFHNSPGNRQSHACSIDTVILPLCAAIEFVENLAEVFRLNPET